MLLGLRRSLATVGQIGLIDLPIIIGWIASALLLVTWISHALGLPRRLGTLIAVGTSICGVSAIVATGPAIDAEEDELSDAEECRVPLALQPGRRHLLGLAAGAAVLE